MAAQPMAADGGLSDITNLLNLVKDQKTTNTSSTNISKEGVTQQINDILQGTNGLAAVAGAQKTAGLYNGSTNTLLTNDLLARASVQVAAKNATTTQTSTKKASVSKQNIESLVASQALKAALPTVKAGANSAIGSIADELGLAYGANDTATANALASVSGAGPGAQVGDFTSLESSLAGGTDINAGSSIAESLVGGGASDAAANAAIASAGAAPDTSVAGLEALDSAAAVGAGSQAAEAASFGAGTAAGAQGAAADFFGESAAAGAGGAASGTADVAGLAAADSAAASGAADAGLAGAAGGATDAGLGAVGATGVGLALIPLVGGISKAIGSGDINDVGDVYGQFGHWAGDRLQSTGDAIGQAAKDATGWIVCTELLRQGKFNRRHYAIGLRVFQSYPQHLTCGYYLWAIPLVAHIRSNPNSRITAISQYLFGARAEYLAARAGVSGAMDTMCNQSISALMYGTCWVLGQALHMRFVLKSWKEKGNSHGWN